jgi:hypothetical protein
VNHRERLKMNKTRTNIWIKFFSVPGKMEKLFFSFPGQMVKIFFGNPGRCLKNFLNLCWELLGKLKILFFVAVPGGQNDFFKELSIIAKGYDKKRGYNERTNSIL